jgi:thioredoxin 1
MADRDVRVVKVNVDDAPEVSSGFGIRSVPTLMFFKDGEPEFEMVGLVPKPVLEREIVSLVEGTVEEDPA